MGREWLKKDIRSKTMRIRSKDDVMVAMTNTNHLAEEVGFLPNEQILLCLVTEEAIVNALEHSTTVESENVEVTWRTTNAFFQMTVKQKGKIFSIAKSEDINYRSRGRGLQLILEIMDKVWLEEDEGGVTLFMQKGVIKDSKYGVEQYV